VSALAKIKLAEAQTALRAAQAAISGAVEEMARVHGEGGAAPFNVRTAATVLGFAGNSLTHGAQFITEAIGML
jgi:hypothetical protein